MRGEPPRLRGLNWRIEDNAAGGARRLERGKHGLFGRRQHEDHVGPDRRGPLHLLRKISSGLSRRVEPQSTRVRSPRGVGIAADERSCARRFRDEAEQDAVRSETDDGDGVPRPDPRPAGGLHGTRERFDEGAVLEGKGVRQPQCIPGHRGLFDAHALGEPAGMEARLLPLGAHDVFPRAAEAAGAARGGGPGAGAGTPAGSWPRTTGAFVSTYHGVVSLPQMPTAFIATTISPGPATGGSMSTTAT